MLNQIDLFNKNIESIRVIDSIYNYLFSQIKAFDISELLRAEFVLIVSALDCYIHGIVREGLINQFKDINDRTNNNISIPLSTVKVLLSVDSNEEQIRILNEQVKEITSKHSYQAPSSIEKALGMININKIWTRISEQNSESADDIKRTLSIIINRRNKIAHEADLDYLNGEKTEITRNEINQCLDFVINIVRCIEVIRCNP